ncbi:RHS repeat-associated core domain-containing protein [Pseudofrankia sp. BMG5.36]|uniref:RHS repeat-associated core domain-containing protein n=1 Tax=Pseudofrankia sp. BMG5.36 TaxID=1834512 RepID=UPI0008D92499|nr:RHS repeat-associated core domain-containing protein [Pseudofrankia sp. BMG5.36]OHV60889.1 hypothetical protein BCD48_40335 [Pseudofrankia sp. BMG5.36]
MTVPPDGALIGAGTGAGDWVTLDDAHGDIVAAFTTDGSALTESRSYDPFGKPRSPVSTDLQIGYQGNWTDPDTGLVAAQARWYDPDTATFLTRDTYPLPWTGTPADNRYTYAAANPLAHNDPTGSVSSSTAAAQQAALMAQKIQNAERERAAQQAAVEAQRRLVAQQAALNAQKIANQQREEAAFWAGVNAALAFQEAERKARAEAEFWAGVNAALAFQEADRQRAAQQAAQNAAQQAAQQAAQNAAYQAAAQRDRDQAAQVAAQQAAHQSAQVATQHAANQSAVQAADTAHQAATAAAAPKPIPPQASPGTFTASQVVLPSAGAGGGQPSGVQPASWLDDAFCVNVVLCAVVGRNHPREKSQLEEWLESPEGQAAMMAVPGGGGEAAGTKGLAGLKGILGLKGDSLYSRLLGKALDKKLAQFCSFAGPTTVLMADGTRKPIEDIQVGDMVIATDPETGEQKPETVTRLWIHYDQLTDLVFADGTVLTTTEDHPYWSVDDQRFEPASELAPGEQVLTANGQFVAVTGLRPLTAHDGLAYNLSVNDIHTYHVGDDEILVHNIGCGVEKWTSQRNLDDHFRRHGEEMGFDSVAEYGYAAEDLMCICVGRREGVLIKRDGNTRYFLDPQSGEFGVASEKGIVTYYRPENPRAHFDSQPGVLIP